jgi:hypothetical protein
VERSRRVAVQYAAQLAEQSAAPAIFVRLDLCGGVSWFPSLHYALFFVSV